MCAARLPHMGRTVVMCSSALLGCIATLSPPRIYGQGLMWTRPCHTPPTTGDSAVETMYVTLAPARQHPMAPHAALRADAKRTLGLALQELVSHIERTNALAIALDASTPFVTAP